MKFLADWTSETHAIDGVESFDHCANSFEVTSDIALGLGERLDDTLCKFQEEWFSSLGRFALLSESQGLVCSFREFNIVKPSSL